MDGPREYCLLLRPSGFTNLFSGPGILEKGSHYIVQKVLS